MNDVTDIREDSDQFTIDQVGCARCGADAHPGITYMKLKRPAEPCEGVRWTHWATCPTTGEPILMTFREEDALRVRVSDGVGGEHEVEVPPGPVRDAILKGATHGLATGEQ